MKRTGLKKYIISSMESNLNKSIKHGEIARNEPLERKQGDCNI